MAKEDVRRFVKQAARQEQFLEVIGRDDAMSRFRAHLDLAPRGEEVVPLAAAPGRVLGRDVVAGVDVPGFDRSGVDGFAVRAADTAGAGEERPVVLALNDAVVAAGTVPEGTVGPGTATVIATGGMVPRGADAVVMIEHTDLREGADGTLSVEIRRAVVPGQFIAAAGSDIGRGETVLRRGQLLGSREIGVLAAVGLAAVAVIRRPTVAIVSTGDEIVAPGDPMRPAGVYDSNGAILAAAVEELGAVPVRLGLARDDEAELSRLVAEGLTHDALLLSGGTSKGAGDLSYRIVSRLTDPGVVAHGVALKPGKPLCLAATAGKPVVILPGFPTSAVFTFHEFVAPVLRALAGRPPAAAETVPATLPMRVPSERGRTEYAMVSLVRGAGGLAAYPMGKGSGAVTAFSQADGFIAIDAQAEAVEAGTPVRVQLIGRSAGPADLIVIGSHCVGLDAIIGRLIAGGLRVKALNVGSLGGLGAAKRGECDIAPIHLMDSAGGAYNRPFLTPALELVTGYRRLQGIVFRPGDPRFEGRTAAEAAQAAAADPACIMMNRNTGSGTRLLTERLLGSARPAGYWTQAKSHNAVAVAVAQERADWGVAIDSVAVMYGLGFLPLQDEHYDFAVPRDRLDREPVRRFIAALEDPEVRAALAGLGFRLPDTPPTGAASGAA